MSKEAYDKIEEIDDVVQRFGEKGISILFLFKFLKAGTIKKLQERTRFGRFDEKKLNALCLQKAKELHRIKKMKPTEKDITELLMKLYGKH